MSGKECNICGELGHGGCAAQFMDAYNGLRAEIADWTAAYEGSPDALVERLRTRVAELELRVNQQADTIRIWQDRGTKVWEALDRLDLHCEAVVQRMGPYDSYTPPTAEDIFEVQGIVRSGRWVPGSITFVRRG